MGTEELGVDSATGRRLFALELSSADELENVSDLPAGHFICLLAWDARGVSTDTVAAVARQLLQAGASYFVCWGPDCERVHDIVDWTLVRDGDELGIPDEAVVMTTWHTSEPLREALWFFLVTACPDDHYEESTQASVAISIGSRRWAAEIKEALQDSRRFIERGAADSLG
jgi:hypothetical protein